MKSFSYKDLDIQTLVALKKNKDFKFVINQAVDINDGEIIELTIRCLAHKKRKSGFVPGEVIELIYQE